MSIPTFVAVFVTLACLALTTHGAVVKYTFDAQDWVVDFMRPTVNLKKPGDRKTPFNVPEENRKASLLINGVYPGPTIEAYENDTVEVTVINNMISESLSIHWHGIHPVDEPWMDGATMVTQAPIDPYENFTYVFRAWPAGTHYWHSHMDGTQAAKGIRGGFIVKKKDDIFSDLYQDERVVVLSDEWQNPDVCLKLEGAMAGNDVCSDIEYASVNGQIALGDLQKFDNKYPYPLIDIEPNKCYRLRFIMMASNAENYIIRTAGHNMTLIGLDGVEMQPTQISSINLRIGERADVILCADQKPGYYPIELMYDYACSLTPGNFIPPGFHPVSSCRFYAFLHYTGQTENIFTYTAPTSPYGTGGGSKPNPVSGIDFDLTNKPLQYLDQAVKPMNPQPEPEKADVQYVVTLGLQGPIYSSPTDQPLSKGRWYMDIDGRRETWAMPTSPLLHTKAECGAEDVPVVNVPEDAVTVEVILNNLSPTAHNIHMHGNLFQVINVANFEWCNVNKTACFVMPEEVNPCPSGDRGFSDENHKWGGNGIENLYWGCKYNEGKDRLRQNLDAPLRKDSFQIWQRSWAVIRFKATHPGIWLFHCHMEQHLPLGMTMAFNVLPSKQKAIPEDVPTQGPCPVWSSNETLPTTFESIKTLQNENGQLKQRIADLERAATENLCTLRGR